MTEAAAVLMSGLRVKEEAKEGARIVDFAGKFVDQAFNVQMWLLENACFVWIGLSNTPPSLTSMSTAIKTPYDPFPLASTLLGGNGDENETQLAQRLVLKTKKQVFVSCNLPDDPELVAYVERTIMLRLRDEQFF